MRTIAQIQREEGLSYVQAKIAHELEFERSTAYTSERCCGICGHCKKETCELSGRSVEPDDAACDGFTQRMKARFPATA